MSNRRIRILLIILLISQSEIHASNDEFAITDLIKSSYVHQNIEAHFNQINNDLTINKADNQLHDLIHQFVKSAQKDEMILSNSIPNNQNKRYLSPQYRNHHLQGSQF